MPNRTKTPLLRLPQKLSFSALGVAALGTIACSGQSSGTADASTADSAVDALADTQVADAPTDSTEPGDGMPACNALMMVCVAKVAGAACPSGPLCHLSDCPDGGCQTELA
jgi:hypothetical protein